jgi:hypothetical protein
MDANFGCVDKAKFPLIQRENFKIKILNSFEIMIKQRLNLLLKINKIKYKSLNIFEQL